MLFVKLDKMDASTAERPFSTSFSANCSGVRDRNDITWQREIIVSNKRCIFSVNKIAYVPLPGSSKNFSKLFAALLLSFYQHDSQYITFY